MSYNPRQYKVPAPFFGNADGNVVNAMDQARIQAYNLYQDLYENAPESLVISMRGAQSLPLYCPSGRKIVNATDRFLAKNFEYYVSPEGVDGAKTDAGTLIQVENYMRSFFDREGMVLKFSRVKKLALARADSVFMLTADPNKAEGTRISIHEVDPRQVFEIDHPSDASRIAGFYIVELITDYREDNQKTTTKQVVRRTAYRKELVDGQYTGKVTHEVTHWTVGKWDDRTLPDDKLERVPGTWKGVEYDIPLDYLPAPISELPIYIFANDKPENSTWGTSLLSGLETLVFGINQSLSDEDLTLVMQGLGMYVTNAAPPVRDGVVTNWNVGPGIVIEIGPEQEFTNVTGVSSVSPYQDHMNWIDEKGLAEASGTPAVAIGRVDVTVAESGISLQLQLDPLLSANKDRELALYITLNQLFYDLVSMWIPAYEGWQTNGAKVVALFDNPMPVNEAQKIQDVVLLRQSNLILTSMAVDALSEMGWKYPPEMSVDEIVAALSEQTKSDAAAIDPFGAQSGGSGDAGDENQDDTTTVEF